MEKMSVFSLLQGERPLGNGIGMNKIIPLKGTHAPSVLAALFMTGSLFGGAVTSGGAQLEYDPSSNDPLMISLSDYSRHALPNPDYCLCLVQDGDCLWVGTTAGAVRWNLADNTSRVFRADTDWSSESASLGTGPDHDKRKIYLEKWLRNIAVRIVVLSPGNVWIESHNGALVVRGEEQQAFASKEEALAVLHASELKPVLWRVVAVDDEGILWRVLRTGSHWGDTELRCYDGKTWSKARQPWSEDGRLSECSIAGNGRGHVWCSGYSGLYLRQRGRWQRYPLESFYEMRFAPSGSLWAFGVGKVARLDGEEWHVIEGKGRYVNFQLPRTIHENEAPVIEAPNGKLYFATGDHGLMCVEGQTFRNTPKIRESTGMALVPDGRVFASTREAIWYLDQDEWKALELPPALARRTMFGGAGEDHSIEDILATRDGTIYVATRAGLYRQQAGQWGKMAPGKPPAQAIVTQPTGNSEQQAAMPEATVAEDEVAAMYTSYVEGEGKELVQATDQQLADDILANANGVHFVSAMVSYYRLYRRDKARAEKCFADSLRAICGQTGEQWIVVMQLAGFGPLGAEPLLAIVRTGTARERWTAVTALAYLRDAKVSEELMKLLDAHKDDPRTRTAIASAVLAAGDPRGMDILIDAATGNVDQLDDPSRQTLQDYTQQYDDLPDDWSKDVWMEWWGKHRKQWKPPGETAKGSPHAEGIRHLHETLQAVATKLEVGRKRGKGL
jgi:hypothetical protein